MRYARHPLVYIVEAADDICYEVMDIEDAHKLKILPTAEVKQLLLDFFDQERQHRCLEVMAMISDPNEQIGYLRSGVIGLLVESCANAFVKHEQEILRGRFQGSCSSTCPSACAEPTKPATPCRGSGYTAPRRGQHRAGR